MRFLTGNTLSNPGDSMTIMEYKNRFKGLKFAWIGDGNNVCNSALLGSAIVEKPSSEPARRNIDQKRIS